MKKCTVPSAAADAQRTAHCQHHCDQHVEVVSFLLNDQFPYRTGVRAGIPFSLFQLRMYGKLTNRCDRIFRPPALSFFKLLRGWGLVALHTSTINMRKPGHGLRV